MQRITIKDENGAILAVLHAQNTIIKETNGVHIDIDGGLRTINTPHSHPITDPPPRTGPAGRQLIQITDDKFITTDGYELHHQGNIWTDGDLSFLADREGHPIDHEGNRLEGHYIQS